MLSVSQWKGKYHHKKRTNSGLRKAVFISSPTLDSLGSAPYVTDLLRVQGPKGVYPSRPVLGFYLPMWLHVSMLVLPNGCPLPRILNPYQPSQPQFTRPKRSRPIMFHHNCTKRWVALTRKVTPNFCSGPLSFMLGLIWGSKRNLAL